MTFEDKLRAALAERNAKVEKCPARTASLGEKPCPKCHSTTSGPCWLNVEADAAFVDAVKDLAA